MVGRERARGSPKRVLVEEGEELVGGRAQGVRGGGGGTANAVSRMQWWRAGAEKKPSLMIS